METPEEGVLVKGNQKTDLLDPIYEEEPSDPYKGHNNIYETLTKEELEEINKLFKTKGLDAEKDFKDLMDKKIQKIDDDTSKLNKEISQYPEKDYDGDEKASLIKEFSSAGEIDKNKLLYLSDAL